MVNLDVSADGLVVVVIITSDGALVCAVDERLLCVCVCVVFVSLDWWALLGEEFTDLECEKLGGGWSAVCYWL